MLTENFDGWGEIPELDEVPLSKQLEGWSFFSRDKKIGVFMSLLRHNKYTKETESSLLQLKALLEREPEHHFRYLTHINGIFNKKDVLDLDAEIENSKETLVGKIFQSNDKNEKINILSVPKELKFISKLAVNYLSGSDADPFLPKTTSNHFTVISDYESDSDDPVSGSKTPHSLPSPGPPTAPKKSIPRMEAANNVRNSTNSKEGGSNNKTVKLAEGYSKSAPKVIQITPAESQKILRDQQESAQRAIELEKEKKAQILQRENEIAKASKQNDRALKKNPGLKIKATSKQSENISRPVKKVSNEKSRKNDTDDNSIKLYPHSDIIWESPLADETIIISSSEAEPTEPNSSDIEFDKKVLQPDEQPRAKKPKCSESVKNLVFHSGYPENGEEKANTTLQILSSSVIVNPEDLNLIMNCLKGSYFKPSHLTKDYYMIIIDEKEKIEDKKITYCITGFEIYFDETEGPRWDLINYNQLDI